MGGCGGQGAEEVVGEEVEVTADIPPPTEAQICRFSMSRLENVTRKPPFFLCRNEKTRQL